MSAEALDWVESLDGLKHELKATAHVMAHHETEHDGFYGSVASLVRWTGKSESQIHRDLAELADIGIILPHPKQGRRTRVWQFAFRVDPDVLIADALRKGVMDATLTGSTGATYEKGKRVSPVRGKGRIHDTRTHTQTQHSPKENAYSYSTREGETGLSTNLHRFADATDVDRESVESEIERFIQVAQRGRTTPIASAHIAEIRVIAESCDVNAATDALAAWRADHPRVIISDAVALQFVSSAPPRNSAADCAATDADMEIGHSDPPASAPLRRATTCVVCEQPIYAVALLNDDRCFTAEQIVTYSRREHGDDRCLYCMGFENSVYSELRCCWCNKDAPPDFVENDSWIGLDWTGAGARDDGRSRLICAACSLEHQDDAETEKEYFDSEAKASHKRMELLLAQSDDGEMDI